MDDLDGLSTETRLAAGRTVCANAESAAEAQLFLVMLGLLDPTVLDRGDDLAQVSDDVRIDNERARVRIRYLIDHDVPIAEVAERAGLSLATVYGVLRRRTASVRTIRHVLSVQLEDCTPSEVVCDQCADTFVCRATRTRCNPCMRGLRPVAAAREFLRQQHAAGMSWRELERVIGRQREQLRQIAGVGDRVPTKHITPELEEHILSFRSLVAA